MSAALVDHFRGSALALVLLVLAVGAAARADELADFHAAIGQVSAECRSAMDVLETSGPEETAAAVSRVRQSWQVVVQRFGAHPPAGFEQQEHTTAMLDVDVRLVGALIIINAGRRDAARQALVGIDEILSRLGTSSAAPQRGGLFD
jgi:hypothetical protein